MEDYMILEKVVANLYGSLNTKDGQGIDNFVEFLSVIGEDKLFDVLTVIELKKKFIEVSERDGVEWKI